MSTRTKLGTVLVMILAMAQPASSAAEQHIPALYSQLAARHIGPPGNRISAVAGLPGNHLVYYAGAAAGGIFKTTDGGTYWKPVFDDQPVSSIGALAVAESDPNLVWAGTGETWIRSNISIGNGVYRSTDGGETWTHMGLQETGRISRLVIHPKDPRIVWVCALGRVFGRQPERGVFKTTDGGETWAQTLFADEETGCSDLAIDPNNSEILFAGMWQIKVHTWEQVSGGPGSGLHRSQDGGTTWKRLEGHGLPTRQLGKIAVSVARSDSSYVYAQIETGDGVPWTGATPDQDPEVTLHPTHRGELFRSTDGGASWELRSYSRAVLARAFYFARHAILPDNKDELFFPAFKLARTIDGGLTLTTLAPSGRRSPGFDHHDIWIDPTNGNRVIVGHDDGFGISENRGETWRKIQLPNSQLYHVAVDNQIPYNVYGNRQDTTTTRGPSNSRLPLHFYEPQGGPISVTATGGIIPGPSYKTLPGVIPRGLWHAVGGGESVWAIPDPVDNDIVWSGGSDDGPVAGTVFRYDERRRQARSVEIWPETSLGAAAGAIKYRFNWTFPMFISPHDHNKVYAGSQYVHQTTDGGNSWQLISGDLSRARQGSEWQELAQRRLRATGGLTRDNIGVNYSGVVFAIAESPQEAGLVWAGSNDGLLWLTRNGGESKPVWKNVTREELLPKPPQHIGGPEWGTVTSIEPSRHEQGTAYVTFDFHQQDNYDPYVFKVTDYGGHWQPIVQGIPPSVVSYAHCVREDPERPGLLYLGTEGALYVSFNDGTSWHPLRNQLPPAPVSWIVVQEHFHDLVLSTYGRGFWIFDNISPLRELPEVLDEKVYLFEPREAYRLQNITAPSALRHDPSAGTNPPLGGPIDYYLKSAPGDEEVKITIWHGQGGQEKLVRTLCASSTPGLPPCTEAGIDPSAGINRIWWDLNSDPSDQIKLRTPPPFNPQLPVGPDGTRPFPPISGFSLLMPPGDYTVKLQVGKIEGTRVLRVRKDPNTAGTVDDVRLQTRLLREIREGLNTVVGDINQIEIIRAQLPGVVARLEGEKRHIVEAKAKSLDEQLVEVEACLLQMQETGFGEDIARWPKQLAGKLQYLAGSVSLNDFPPTETAQTVNQMLKQQVRYNHDRLQGHLDKDLVAFNALLRELEVPGVSSSLSEEGAGSVWLEPVNRVYRRLDKGAPHRCQ